MEAMVFLRASFDFSQRLVRVNSHELGLACRPAARWPAAAMPGAPAPFVAAGHMLFDSLEAMQSSFARHVREFLSDLPNFTNIQPTLQISEVVS